MSHSNSKKALLRKLRHGKSDPRKLRGSWGNVKPIVRVKPNKKKEDEDNEL